MMVREPVVAGQFYPGTRDTCIRMIDQMKPAAPAPADLPERPVAAIVPHAGWVYSGGTALAALAALKSRRVPKTGVLFGAVHSHRVRQTSIFSFGGWQTPLGLVQVDDRLAREILAQAPGLITDDPRAHEQEHSLEVQVPLIRYLMPEARIVPIAVLPDAEAPAVGRIVGQVIQNLAADAVCVGSTDLTHYGPGYGFAPAGIGPAAHKWMRDVNDRRMIDLLLRLDAEAAVAEARISANACGAGAIAATLAAARELGAKRGCLVQYTTSYDVSTEKAGAEDFEMAVGYAGLVF